MRTAARRWDLSNSQVLQNFCQHVGQMQLSGKRPVVEFVPEKRSLDQNAMIYALYQQIASQVDDESILDIRRRLKLTVGVPILRAGNAEFRGMYDKSIRGTLTYEEKLRAMDFLPVTSLMDKAQCTQFIDAVIREESTRGLCLVHPSEAESWGG